MAKISQEEYEILKEALNEGYEWIARDSHNTLCTHRHKPVKQEHWIQQYWGNPGNGYKEIDDRLFQFIQWEDEEPYNIAWLLGEYEEAEYGYFNNELYERFYEESEETEVKDIEWLKREVKKLEDKANKRNQFGSEYTDEEVALENVVLLLNQLDEPETELESIYQDVLEQGSFKLEGIDYLVLEEKHYRDMEDAFNGKLNNSLVIEVPIIPQFVANYIKWFKNDFEHNFAADIDYIISLIQVSHNFSRREKIKNWISKSGNAQKLIDAYRWGYEVEEEQKYYVPLGVKRPRTKEPVYLMKAYKEGLDVDWSPERYIKSKTESHKYRFTEQEIKDYDERYWPFAVKVEEMEE